MCGIVGVLYKDPQKICSEEMIVRMRDLMFHRGPDDQGHFIDRNVGLAHRRLSIIDLSTGDQPMSTTDGRFTIVFNGEIYNYRELREELRSQGHVFLTHSDTEVILRLYAKHGQAAVPKLNGIFAFAIYDKKRDQLLLARDRMGIKPLYYNHNKAGFVFASEIKSLFSSGLITPACNSEVVPEYFIFRQVAGEQTLFRDVLSLPPAHMLIYESGKMYLKRYWSVYDSDIQKIGFQEAVVKLDNCLYAAVKRQLLSDVPLGTFCSGGIDSSLITALASKMKSEPLNTYSVGFHEAEFDETHYARIVSRAYKTNHHELKLNAREFAEHIPAMIWHNDEPLNFANSIQIYAISQLAKEKVTVVLTGEGADELFGGYPRYFIPWLLRPMQCLPKTFHQIIIGLLGIWKDHRLQKLREYATTTPADILIYNASTCARKIIKPMLNHQYNIDSFDFREDLLCKDVSRDPISQLALMDQQTYLLSILNRQDKMSMAASVEARVPFLDNKVVDLANSLPIVHKIRFPQRKRVLMAVAERYLPRQVIRRRKSGFGVPLRDWFRTDAALCEYLIDLAVNPLLTEYFDSSQVGKLIDDHRSGDADYSEFLWTAINFVIWRKSFNV